MLGEKIEIDLVTCYAGEPAGFHGRVFRVTEYGGAAGRNQLVLQMYRPVERARKGELWGSLKRRNDSRERRAVYQHDHLELVDALCARGLSRAVEVMDAHLARVEANLLGVGAQAATA